MYFKHYLMSVYLFVNITRFDLYSVILFCCFYGGNRGKPTGKIHFSRLRVRSASLANLRIRICYQNNGGSNISKRENSELWREYFPNFCTCFAWGATDSDKVSFYLLIHVKIM
jgi:N-acetylmuramoyl-L-alanine amidase CwlA